MMEQLSFNYGLVRLNKSLTLERCHKLSAWSVCNFAAGRSLIDELLNDYAKGKKRFHRSKHEPVLSNVLANALWANSQQKGVLISRDSNYAQRTIYNALTEFLAERSLIDLSIQPPNEQGGCASFFYATPELVRLLNVHRARLAVGSNFKPLIVRNADGKEISTNRMRQRSKRKFAELEAPVHLHNLYWSRQSVTIGGCVVVPFVHRVFNRSSLELGGRFYGAYQSTPSAERLRFLMNGKRCAEVDYTALHLAIMYAWSGVKFEGDPYSIPGYDRGVTKAILLRLANSENIPALKAVITASANPKRKAEYKEYRQRIKLAEIHNAGRKPTKRSHPRKPRWIDSFIPDIPDGFNADEFISALFEYHKPVSHLFGSENLGLRLQYADAQLMADVLRRCYTERSPVPVLPVHDSVVCRVRDVQRVKMIMLESFRLMFGVPVGIKVSEPESFKRKPKNKGLPLCLDAQKTQEKRSIQPLQVSRYSLSATGPTALFA